MPKIIELARTQLIKGDINSSFRDIATTMLKDNVGSVIITREGEILGFIDEKVILDILAKGKNPLEQNINDYIEEFPTLHQDIDILEAWELVNDKKDERWGIINNQKKIIGIIRKRTINDFRIRILREELNIQD